MPLVFGAQGVSAGLRGQATNVIELQAGQVRLLPPGNWEIVCGLYTVVQQLDPITGIWRSLGDGPRATINVNSDGVNTRIANQTGCVVGALLTTAGSGYTSAPTCTASGGGAVFSCIVGGALNTSVTVSNGGAQYTYPPIVEFDAPPQGGIQATAYASLTSGVVSSITVTDQGAGYASAPNVYITPDPRDTTGHGASAVCVLTGAGTVTGILVTDHGTPQTSIPTLSFSGGGGSAAAATALMCWSITAYTVSAAGSGYAGAVEVTGLGGTPTTTPAYTNPTTQTKLVRKRRASIVAALSGVTITATGQVVDDGGIYDGTPTVMILSSQVATLTTAATLILTMGGQNDRVVLMAA